MALFSEATDSHSNLKGATTRCKTTMENTNQAILNDDSFLIGPPSWLFEKMMTNEVFQDGTHRGVLCFRVCRNCQSTLASCICGSPTTGDFVPVWRQGQGLNDRLVAYLSEKKAKHEAERVTWLDNHGTVNSKAPSTPEQMRARQTLWASSAASATVSPVVPIVAPASADPCPLFPAELKALPRWGVYKIGKVPFNATTHNMGNLFESEHQSSFETACTALAANPDYKGLGFGIVYSDGRTFLDFDHCVANGEIQPDIQKILQDLNTYAEFSPSGEGVHACLDGWQVPKGGDAEGHKAGNAEIYSGKRYFTVTGKHIPGTPLTVNRPDPGVIAEVYKRILAGEWKETKATKTGTGQQETVSSRESVQIENDGSLVITSKLCLLMSGTITSRKPFVVADNHGNSVRYPSQSEADQALCNLLAMENQDVDAIDDQFRESSLYREKWERQDYRERTIKRAIEAALKIESAAVADSFAEPESQSGSEPGPGSNCLIFETPPDVALAQSLGFNAEFVTASADALRADHTRIVLFGTSAETKGLKTAIGKGANCMPLPEDKTADPVVQFGRKKYPPCKSLVEAASQYSNEEFKAYFDHLLSMEAVQRSTTREDEGNSCLRYDMTKEEIAEQDAAEYPVYRLHEPAGPHFDESILYGPAGQIAKKIAAYNESHIAAIYLNILVSLGNAFGRHAYFNVNKTEHFLNENLACVGDSSTSRKGTGGDEVDHLLGLIAGGWMNRCNMGGFGSGQGIIRAIRDEATYKRFNKIKRVYEDITRPGIGDKRLCVREGELSNILKLMADPKQRVDELVRNAWDSKKLQNIVAGTTDVGESRSEICSKPHVSIIGYTTGSLLKATVPVGFDTSGSGNRFLYCYIKRLKLVPNGGPMIDWSSEMVAGNSDKEGRQESFLIYLCRVLEDAQKDRLIPLADSARKYWNNLYQRMEKARPQSRVAGITSRGPAHVRRLATILCLIDLDVAVQVKHLEAALAIWKYCEESAEFIFEGYSRDGAKILKLAHVKKDCGIGLNDVHDLFKRNKTAAWVKTQVTALVDGGYLIKAGELHKFKKW